MCMSCVKIYNRWLRDWKSNTWFHWYFNELKLRTCNTFYTIIRVHVQNTFSNVFIEIEAYISKNADIFYGCIFGLRFLKRRTCNSFKPARSPWKYKIITMVKLVLFHLSCRKNVVKNKISLSASTWSTLFLLEVTRSF